MRILTVSAGLPYPPHDGTRLRSWHLLAGLAAHHEVVALTWVGTEEPPLEASADVAALAAASPDAVVARRRPASRAVPARARRQLVALAGGRPPFVQEVIEERAGTQRAVAWQRIRLLHDRRRFDLAVAESEEALPLVPDLGVPLVVHRHNVFTPTMASQRSRRLARLLWLVERSIWRRFDRDTVADLVLATTCESAERLRALGVGPVRVVPNGVALPTASLDPARGSDLAFLGPLDYSANLQSVRWFVEAVWPLVRARHPASRLRVIGRGQLPNELRVAGVTTTGSVDRLAPALDGVRVGVVPLRSGMGIKNKTLELLAHGLPVVSTPLGTEGIVAPASVTVASGAEATADSILTLLADPALAAARGAAGRRHVAVAHTWARAVELYDRALVEAASRGDRVLS